MSLFVLLADVVWFPSETRERERERRGKKGRGGFWGCCSKLMCGLLLDCRTWPVNEQIIDIIHKSVYAFFTGYVTDRVIQ